MAASQKTFPSNNKKESEAEMPGNIKGVLEELKKLISEFFSDSPPDIKAGQSADQISKIALQQFRKRSSDEEKASLSELLFLRGKILVMLGKYGEVITLLNNEKEKQINHWELLGIAYLKTKEYTKAESCSAEILKTDPMSFSANILKGSAILLQNSYLQRSSEFETCRWAISVRVGGLSQAAPAVLREYAKDQYWFEIFSILTFNKNNMATVKFMAAILQNLENAYQKNFSFNIAILYGFMAHINYINRNYDDAMKFAIKCEGYLKEMIESVKELQPSNFCEK